MGIRTLVNASVAVAEEKPAKKNRVTLSVSLPIELVERLKEYRYTARKEHLSTIIVEALESYLPK